MSTDIAYLIETKAFSDLSDSERHLVLDQMDENEYNLRREIVNQAKSNFQNEKIRLTPNDEIRLAALDALRNQQEQKKKKVLQLFIYYKVPGWIAAAAILIAFFIPSFLDFSIDEPTTINQQISQVDTVYIEKNIIDTVEITGKPDTVVKVVYISNYSAPTTTKNSKKNSTKENPTAIPNQQNTFINNYQPEIEFNEPNKHKSKSLLEDELAQSVLGLNN